MKDLNFVLLRSKLLLVVLFALFTNSLSAQDARVTTEFKPYIGQEGKDVIWVPTPESMVNTMLNIAKVTSKDFVIDLGSGDGRTVIAAAKRGAKARGLEFNPEMVALSKTNATKEGVGKSAEFIQGDLFEADLSQATVITMFLLPEINLKLRPKLLELKPGTRIVSNSFLMDEWVADSTERAEEDCDSWCDAYLWIVPAKVEGTWKTSDGELNLSQDFQIITGTMKRGKRTVKITQGRLHGNLLTFNVNDEVYSGIVNRDRIENTSVSGKNNRNWDAVR